MTPCKTIALIGQTASGKTKTAIKLAQDIGGEIISADSRQVYKGLDIGSDKVAKEAMQGVPHHLLDVADPHTERFTVGDFVEQAEAAIANICSRGNVPIVAGGTMLYIDALFGNVQVPAVPPNETLRDELEQRGLTSLFQELQEKNPVRAATVEPSNKRRIIRALEIVATLGTVPPVVQDSPRPPDPNVIWLGLHHDPEQQKQKIEQRNAEMLERGLLEEVQRLHASGVPWERFTEFGFEYKYPAMYLSSTPIIKDEPPTLEQVLMKMNSSTWRYAKKQKSWWQDREEIQWFTPTEYDSLLSVVKSFLLR